MKPVTELDHEDILSTTADRVTFYSIHSSGSKPSLLTSRRPLTSTHSSKERERQEGRGK